MNIKKFCVILVLTLSIILFGRVSIKYAHKLSERQAVESVSGACVLTSLGLELTSYYEENGKYPVKTSFVRFIEDSRDVVLNDCGGLLNISNSVVTYNGNSIHYSTASEMEAEINLNGVCTSGMNCFSLLRNKKRQVKK